MEKVCPIRISKSNKMASIQFLNRLSRECECLVKLKYEKNLNLLLSIFLFWNSGGVCCPGFQSQGGFAQSGIHLYCDICRLLA